MRGKYEKVAKELTGSTGGKKYKQETVATQLNLKE